MRVSELCNKLSTTLEEHGDGEVLIATPRDLYELHAVSSQPDADGSLLLIIGDSVLD